MSDATLTDIFCQQSQRLHRDIMAHWQVWQAGDESELAPLRHAVHLLKGAALTVAADAVAQTLHDLESHLQAGQQASALTCWPVLSAVLMPWLDDFGASPALPTTTSPDSLRRALREGFAAQVRLSGQPATLHLQLDPHWPSDLFLGNAFLWDVLPQLLRNSLVHGGESGAVRLAAGKPERLQVWLRLRCRGERLFLIVADDGRGQARPAQTVDLMAGRGWGVAAVRDVVASLPSGRLGFRCRVGMGSMVRISYFIALKVL